jgi:hypothetical protein
MKRSVIVAISLLVGSVAQAKDVTTDDLYASFNMRSIFSSFGPRLKYYCQSYPREYFPGAALKEKTATRLVLESGDDVWVLTIVGRNRVSVGSSITSGSYRSDKEYALTFDAAHSDWRASETLIEAPRNCAQFKAQ